MVTLFKKPLGFLVPSCGSFMSSFILWRSTLYGPKPSLKHGPRLDLHGAVAREPAILKKGIGNISGQTLYFKTLPNFLQCHLCQKKLNMVQKQKIFLKPGKAS